MGVKRVVAVPKHKPSLSFLCCVIDGVKANNFPASTLLSDSKSWECKNPLRCRPKNPGMNLYVSKQQSGGTVSETKHPILLKVFKIYYI